MCTNTSSYVWYVIYFSFQTVIFYLNTPLPNPPCTRTLSLPVFRFTKRIERQLDRQAGLHFVSVVAKVYFLYSELHSVQYFECCMLIMRVVACFWLNFWERLIEIVCVSLLTNALGDNWFYWACNLFSIFESLHRCRRLRERGEILKVRKN